MAGILLAFQRLSVAICMHLQGALGALVTNLPGPQGYFICLLSYVGVLREIILGFSASGRWIMLSNFGEYIVHRSLSLHRVCGLAPTYMRSLST